MTRHIVCPSGLSGEVRSLKTKDANLFQNRKLGRKGRIIATLLERVWESTDSSGVYELKDGKPDWMNALTGDRYYAAIQSRVETYGPVVELPIDCGKCDREFIAELNLEEDFPVRRLPEESIEVLQNGGRFEFHLPKADKKLWYHLQTGQDEKRGSDLLGDAENKDKQLTISVAVRVDEIDEVHANDKVRFIDDLDMADQVALYDNMVDRDCGVETTLRVECDHCGRRQSVELPLADPAFWFPVRRARTRGF